MQVRIAHLVKILPKSAGFKSLIRIERKLSQIRRKVLKFKDIKKKEKVFKEQVLKEASVVYRKNKGELGYFDFRKMSELFPQYKKAFLLKKGAISDVLATEHSRQIIIVLDKKGGKTVPLAQAKPMIEQRLMMAQGQKLFEQWLTDYSKKFKITIK